jgi:Spy/CpxP family protein refolding chaperone
MKKTRLVIIGLVVSFFTVSSVYAQTQSIGRSDGDRIKEGIYKKLNLTPEQGRPDGDRIKEGIYKELNLTPEQHKKIEENRKAQREKASQLRTTMMEKDKQLLQALKDPGVTRANIEPLVNEIKSLQAQLIDQRVSGIFAVKEILSPKQISKFNQLMEKRKEGRKGRFQEWQKKRKGMESDQGDQ